MSLVALPPPSREMLREPEPCRRARVCAAPCGQKKRPREAAREAFDVRKEVFAVGEMSCKERSSLRKRFQGELVAVRGLLNKLAAVEGGRGATPSSSPPAAPRGKDGRSEEPIEAGKSNTAERRKTSPSPPPAEHIEAPPPKMTPAEREELAFSLAALSAELSPETLTLLQKQSHGRRGEVVVDAHSMGDAALFELKKQLDKFFVKTRSDPPPMAQDDGKIVDDEGENGLECVDVCRGGVSHSRTAIARPPPRQLEILDQCGGDIFAATGVDKLMSPLQQKHLSLAEKVVAEEEEEYVDICGDASPVVILQNPGPIFSRSTSTSSSSSDSDSDSDGSDSGSGSDSCPAAPAAPPEVNGESSGRQSEPAREAVQNAAEPEKVSSPSAPVLPLPKANDDSEALPSEPAMEAVHNAEAEKMSSPPAPALLLHEANGDSAKQLDVVQQNAEQEIKLPVNPQSAAAPAARSMSELIAEAQEKRWHEEMSRAREKARQELAETERSAMTSDRVHPLEMKELGIAQIEHIVSDIAQQQTLLHGVRPGLLQKLGLFLKADDEDDDEQQQQPSSVPGDDDLEEGEIR